MKPIILSTEQWKIIITAILKDYPPSVRLSREKMKRVLGFTPRMHTNYNNQIYRKAVHLDFYNEHYRTMFLLKYGDRLEIKNIDS